ncbi:MAG: molybdopterin cofactor-binding domain-containing protein, partial [Clostridiales bacterium]
VKRNICASGSYGDREASEDIYQKCPLQIDEIYYTKAQSQTAMENFVSYTYLDHRGRLVIYSSTQIVFHVRRIIASSMIRVIKPKVGGGFGAKQTAVSEFYPAFVTWKTGKAAKIVYDRQESFIASNSRHAMRVHVRLGADREGKIKTILLDALSNTGAYGEHGSTTVGLTGGKSLAVYQTEATCFNYQVVYTNTMPAAAFRGYGNPQGCFAVESAVNQLADLLAMDPLELRIKNVVRTGDFMPAYDNRGEKLLSGSFLACLEKGADIFHWKEKFAQNKCQDFISAGKRRGVGLALCMQSSGIADIDTASAWIRLNDDGFYTLSIGAADMGTGCDTILPQIAGEVLQCPLERIIISSIDTDSSPFDSGSYASSTTYVTGRAVFDAAEKLREKIIAKGGLLLDLPKEDLAFDGDAVYSLKHDKKLSLNEIACQMTMGRGEMLQAQATYGSSVSPPPLMAGFVEIEVDTETGLVKVIDMLGIVDCGTVINSNLARIQAEGGLVQGLGFALMEDVFYTDKGKMITDSFMQYKIPSRLDIGKIRVDFVDSFEPTGPYGAKSIGEVVINTPPPAISAALHQGAGIYLRELPIRSDKVLKKIKNQK